MSGIPVNEGVSELVSLEQHPLSAPIKWLDIRVPNMALVESAVVSGWQQNGELRSRVIQKKWTTL